VSRPRDLADGEREAFRHGRGSWNDNHLVRLGELYAHPLPGVPLSTKAGRQSTLGYAHGSSLSVDGAQATNLMVMQDTDKVFIQVRPPCGRNTYVLRLIVLDCVERIMCPKGVPCPSLYSPEDRVTDLETNPSRLQLP